MKLYKIETQQWPTMYVIALGPSEAIRKFVDHVKTYEGGGTIVEIVSISLVSDKVIP